MTGVQAAAALFLVFAVAGILVVIRLTRRKD